MSKHAFLTQLTNQLEELHTQGLYKDERAISTPQSGLITDSKHNTLVNLCANNYLGLASSDLVIQHAHAALDLYGYGMASVRFICGTQTIHQELEQELSQFLGMEDTILYSSCFDANTGLFETLLSEDDAIISDALNHASIIDGIRLCKAKRYRYKNNDAHDLEQKIHEAQAAGAKTILIVTDGVFSMDGTIADLRSISHLAEKYDTLLMVDDSHAVGFLGEHGKGSHEYCEVMGKVDIITGTLGKALGGASGGYTSASKEIIDWLRQRSRPYLFSNSLAPTIASTSLQILRSIQQDDSARRQLKENADYFREKMAALGFDLKAGSHPIIPIMLGDAILAKKMADELYKLGIYVTSFSYPVVPLNQARIRTQMSAALTKEDLDIAIKAFAQVGRQLNLIEE